MAEFALTTELDAPIDAIWTALQRPQTLIDLSKGWLSFRPIDPPSLPEQWSTSRYRVALRAFGWVPIGQQVIGVEVPATDPPMRRLRDNGSGSLVRVWDHVIELVPLSDASTRYTDRVRLQAGLLTPLILIWARGFYAHRQRQWRTLAKTLAQK